jgi:hypothetical protein
MSIIEVRANSDGSIDEVVTADGAFHLEQMSRGHWSLVIETCGERLMVNITPKRAFVYEAQGVTIRVTDTSSAPPLETP